LPVSISLGAKAILLAVSLGSIFGVIAALKQNSKFDYAVMSLAMTGVAVPNFVWAPIMTLFFGIYLRLLPVAGWGDLRHQVLPVLALALPQVAMIARLMRGSMIEVLRSNYIRAARAKGMPERRVVSRHALRAAVLPLVSYLGPHIAGIVTGSVIIEQIFNLPGVGRYFIQGALNRDYPLVLGIVIVYSSAVIVLNLIVDIIYGWLDPKVKYA
jgi:oligopeptide transport system permease protein